MFVPLLVSLAAAAAPAGCPVARTPAELDAALAGVEAAWGVDEAAFSAGMGTARGVLACLGAPVDPALAARYHRAEGLAAYLNRDTAAAARAFAAARPLDPAYRFPPAMVPPGNPIDVAWQSAPAAPPDTRPAPPPAGGARLWLDGASSRARPVDRPAVVQVQVDDALSASAWLAPGDPLPYVARGTGKRGPLLVVAGVAGLAAAGLYGGAMWSEQDWRASPSEDEADARGARTNGFVAASAGTAALAAGTAIGAFVVGRW